LVEKFFDTPDSRNFRTSSFVSTNENGFAQGFLSAIHSWSTLPYSVVPNPTSFGGFDVSPFQVIETKKDPVFRQLAGPCSPELRQDAPAKIINNPYFRNRPF